jgi:hypothetical protein
MRVTRLAFLTRLVSSTGLSKFLPRLGGDNEARMPILAHLSLISTCFSIGFPERGRAIEPVDVVDGSRDVDAIFSGDKD